MAERPVAEPLFWLSVGLAIVGLPLVLGPDTDPAFSVRLLGHSVLGLATFGIGSAVLAAAFGAGRLPHGILVVAFVALVAGGLNALLGLGALAPGLRIFTLTILMVGGAGLSAIPRAWSASREDPAAAPAP